MYERIRQNVKNRDNQQKGAEHRHSKLLLLTETVCAKCDYFVYSCNCVFNMYAIVTRVCCTLGTASLSCLSSNITRNSSGDEIANVNFLCDDIVHELKIQ